MVKRGIEKNIRESYKILVKVWRYGESIERDINVGFVATVGGLKNKLNEVFNSENTQRLTLMVRTIKLSASYDNIVIKSLPDFNAYKEHSITLHAMFQTDKYSKIQMPTIREDESEAYKYLKVIHVLNRNAKNCAIDACNDKSPFTRKQYDRPEEPVSKRPKVADFAKCSMEVSSTLEELSKSMMTMSNKLVEGTESGYHMDTNIKRLIQNNMDTCRYLAPLLKSLSALSVPVGSGLESEIGLKTGNALIISAQQPAQNTRATGQRKG